MVRFEQAGPAAYIRGAAIVIGASIALCSLTAAASPDTLDGLSAFTQGEYAEALQAWQRAAAGGDANGALYAGVLYDTGEGVRQDDATALAFYRRAASLGSAVGAFNVGVMYDAGRGMQPDPAEAATWYGMAARRGYARADYNLALLYESGIGVRRSRARAARLFQAAADRGLSAARAHLGTLGAGAASPGHTQAAAHTPAATDPAMQVFQRAQQALLARTPEKSAEAASLFRAAADQGSAMAAYDLGYCYENGIGVAASRLQAFLWYSRAAAATRDPQLRGIAEAGRSVIQLQLTPAELARLKDAVGQHDPVIAAPSPPAAPAP